MSFQHPRRVAKTNSSDITFPSPTSRDVEVAMSSTKSATFHSPPAAIDSSRCIPSLPRRSETSLDDVVDAYKRRMALNLEDIDRTFAGLSIGSSRSTGQSFTDNGFPDVAESLCRPIVSSSELQKENKENNGNTPIVRGRRESSVKGARSSRQSSTCSSSSYKQSGSDCESTSASSVLSCSTSATSVFSVSKQAPALSSQWRADQYTGKNTNSTSSSTSHSSERSIIRQSTRLSIRAKNKIHEHILRPLLAESSLIDYHPLIEDCPNKIHNKQITCLRDLERTLLSAAPKLSKSPQLYLDFCLSTLHVVQATVEFLNEPDLVLPTDRPYTGGYFIDLVDQLKNYAHQIHTSRAPESKGESSSDSRNISPGEIKLYGGFSRNGRPAELVRIMDGKAYSLATGLAVPMENLEDDITAQNTMKRGLEVDHDDDSILRSMARRKGSNVAKPPRQCNEPGCGKTYARDCDLAKHQKTHSRPWKCPHETCKFHQEGWPTEKEMSRHLNDKHNPNPKLFKCLFPPCEYESRRDSNRKQHMEKQHNWTYDRIKEIGVRKPHKKYSSSKSGSDRSRANSRNRSKRAKRAQLTPVTDTQLTPDSGTFYPTPEHDEDDTQERIPTAFPTPVSDVAYPAGELDIADAQMSGAELYMSSPYSIGEPADIVTANYGRNDFVLYDEDIYSAQAQVPTYWTPATNMTNHVHHNHIHQANMPHVPTLEHGYAQPLPTPAYKTIEDLYLSCHLNSLHNTVDFLDTMHAATNVLPTPMQKAVKEFGYGPGSTVPLTPESNAGLIESEAPAQDQTYISTVKDTVLESRSEELAEFDLFTDHESYFRSAQPDEYDSDMLEDEKSSLNIWFNGFKTDHEHLDN